MIFWLGLLGLLILLQFAVLFGPPYLPTRRRQRQEALRLLDLKQGQTLYDLGCGDGSLIKEAAKQGTRAVGYEINPLLAGIAWLRTRRERERVKIILGNFWKADISDADGVFVFLAEQFMKRLDKFMSGQKNKKTIKLVSYGFSIPGKKSIAKKGAMLLYLYR